jgi:hypothetical protein
MPEKHMTLSSEVSRVSLGPMPRTLRLHPGLITVDGSRFRKTIGDFVMLPRNMPEPNLRDLSLVCSQHTFLCDN